MSCINTSLFCLSILGTGDAIGDFECTSQIVLYWDTSQHNNTALYFSHKEIKWKILSDVTLYISAKEIIDVMEMQRPSYSRELI